MQTSNFVADAVLSSLQPAAVALGRLASHGLSSSVSDITVAQNALNITPSFAFDAIADALLNAERAVLDRSAAAAAPLQVDKEGHGALPITWVSTEQMLLAAADAQSDGTRPLIAIFRSAGAGRFSEIDKSVLRVALASEVSRPAAASAPVARGPEQLAIAAANAVDVPLFVLDRDQTVLMHNRAATEWLDADDRFAVRNDRLIVWSKEIEGPLRAGLQAVLSGERTEPVLIMCRAEVGGAVPQAQLMLALTVSPDAADIAILSVVRPKTTMPLAEHALAALGLTSAERRLAACLVAGMTVRQAAEHCNVRELSARSYLKRVFDKLGIRRQSELMSLAIALTPRILFADDAAKATHDAARAALPAASATERRGRRANPLTSPSA